MFVVEIAEAATSFGDVVTIAGGVGAVGSTVCAIAVVP
jgi:NADPH-dependent curcumin reductase CurA